jgi:DNA-binding MarR family transcriptional regulator
MKKAFPISSHGRSQEGKATSQDKRAFRSPRTRSPRPKEGIKAAALPATVSTPQLLEQGSDGQFRALVQNMLTIARRVEMARDYFGHLIHVTGPQYHLLMTVAQLQGTLGVAVGAVAQVMHVSSAFVTSETGKLSVLGLLKKRPNPRDRRGALLSLTATGQMKIHQLIPEIRAVNDLFFGRLDAQSFRALCTSAAALVHGSQEAMRYTGERRRHTHE